MQVVVVIALFLCWRFLGMTGMLVVGGVIVAVMVVVAIRAAASPDPSPNNQPRQQGAQSSEDDEGIPVRAHLKLAYRDADDALTDREVMVSRYVPDGDGYIVAFCKLRKDSRTFRLNRIIEAVDLETGEVLPVSRMRSWLRKRRA